MMRYSPFASVMTVLAFSISAGLLASTVTPGSTAPVVSLTTPAIALCASALPGDERQQGQPRQHDHRHSPADHKSPPPKAA